MEHIEIIGEQSESVRNFKLLSNITFPFITEFECVDDIETYRNYILKLKQKADLYLDFINLLEKNTKL